jgi:hypothetical protein
VSEQDDAVEHDARQPGREVREADGRQPGVRRCGAQEQDDEHALLDQRCAQHEAYPASRAQERLERVRAGDERAVHEEGDEGSYDVPAGPREYRPDDRSDQERKCDEHVDDDAGAD